jgi:hypothetical protein
MKAKAFTKQEIYNLIVQAQMDLSNMDPDRPMPKSITGQFQGLYGMGVEPETAYIADKVWRKDMEDRA